MLSEISNNYLITIDQYIKNNLENITCGDVQGCYKSFVDVSKQLSGVHANYKSLPEYIVHRFIYYLFEQEIIDNEYDIVPNKRFRNKEGKTNELDIALVATKERGNEITEGKLLKGISVKAASKVDMPKDSERVNNLLWGTSKDANIVQVTFFNNFNDDPNKYLHEQYQIINLEKESEKIFIHELKKKLSIDIDNTQLLN